MTISFHAKCVAIEDMMEDDYWLVGFADDEFETTQYLMLQRGMEDDEQDVRFGMNTYHVERDGQQYSMYGGIERFVLQRDRLLVDFTPEGQVRLQTSTMKITFAISDEKFARLKEQLGRVFADTTCLVIPTE
jgi:hypothetical protein